MFRLFFFWFINLLLKTNLGFFLGKKCETLRCIYLPEKDKCIFSDTHSVSVRRDIRGILLLDTALQIPVKRPDEVIRLEIPLAEVPEVWLCRYRLLSMDACLFHNFSVSLSLTHSYTNMGLFHLGLVWGAVDIPTYYFVFERDLSRDVFPSKLFTLNFVHANRCFFFNLNFMTHYYPY